MSSFRLLQFNMQFGQIWDDQCPDQAPVDLGQTIAAIRSVNPDIVHLQEVEHAMSGGAQIQPPPNYTRMREALSEYHGYFSYPRADERELPFGIGLAILSKAPLNGIFREDLPSPPVEFDFYGKVTTPTDRLLIGAKTTVAGREVSLLNTHLLAFFMLKTSSEIHGEQRLRLLQHLQAATGPTLLSGDFNIRQHESIIHQFGTAGFQTVQSTELTWRRMPYLLDHIFYNPSLRCVRSQVIPTMASDHHMLVGDFEFADQTG